MQPDKERSMLEMFGKVKDLFVLLSGFSLLIVIYFLQRQGMNYQLYFLRPLSISVLSLACYVFLLGLELGSEKGIGSLGKNNRIEEDPK